MCCGFSPAEQASKETAPIRCRGGAGGSCWGAAVVLRGLCASGAADPRKHVSALPD